jgi:hypothetical protein
MVGLDPEYVFAKPTYYGCPNQYTGPIPSTIVQISLEGDSAGEFSHRTPNDPSYNLSHLYQYLVIGTGQEAFIRFADPNPNDNYGCLRVIVESTAVPIPGSLLLLGSGLLGLAGLRRFRKS